MRGVIVLNWQKWIGLVVISVTLLLLFSIFFYNSHLSRCIDVEESEIAAGSLKMLAHPLSCEGSEPAVLLLHGYGGSPHDLLPLFEKFSNVGQACYVPVLPGHGSSVRQMDRVQAEDWQQAARSAWIELRKKYTRIDVAGFSMGGALAIILATEMKPERLALIAPYFRVNSSWNFFGTPEQWSSRVSKIIPYLKKLKIGQINDPEGIKLYEAYHHVSLQSVSELAKIGAKAMEKVEELNGRLLWFHSRIDVVADPRLSYELFTKCPSKKKLFISLEKSNHVLSYDFERKKVLDRIFLEFSATAK
jgi:carboxylesterase